MIELARSWWEQNYPVRVRENVSGIINRFVGYCFFSAGWINTGDIPAEVENCVIVFAPHTSNIDFVLGVATFIIRGIRVRILIKDDWFFFPFGPILKSLGGVPVARDKSQNFVDYMACLLTRERDMRIIVCPEGTRKAVTQWKTGFYYAALKAGVPLVLTSLDYRKKIARIGNTFYPTGDYVADMTPVQDFYRDVHPRHPEGFNPNIM
ncbi:1-acyl-sn-glycerol-3-phosphate acyltransferase [Syntrophomonas palmitatica]|uniref:1-acyl-sn-glycerol-3-phosphate acyltransferase n=1 Tax=Syntrophomonas palmitatica TaxID=402877 RepID=UPI0006D1A403|nr:1-acyl-sn-glycerol-3-phosphate acyltransferase [Syntrophomonas palmitatica]